MTVKIAGVVVVIKSKSYSKLMIMRDHAQQHHTSILSVISNLNSFQVILCNMFRVGTVQITNLTLAPFDT